MKNKKILLAIIPVILVMTAISVVPALATTPIPGSLPLGCMANDFNVNIARSVAIASPGDTITFTVSAGNPMSTPDNGGCDITGMTLTVTLPNGTTKSFGPSNYPYPTAVGFVGSVDYVAKLADVVGNSWTARVNWAGTLTDGFNSPSSGMKETSVTYVQPLQVTKTAVPAIQQTYAWTIDKSVTPAALTLFNGDTGTSEYTVAVVKTLSGTVDSVTGTITIHNPNSMVAIISSVTDGITGVVTPATVNCPVSFPYTLAAGADLVCTYSATLPNTLATTNTATVTTTGDVAGGSGTAPIDFTNVVPTVVGGSINVDDTYNGGTWAFSNSGSVKYSRTFDCSGLTYTDGHASYSRSNTATIRGTALSDSATVNVDCYKPLVTKTAVADFDRSYTWNILKSGPSSLTVDLGQTSSAAYTVTVTKSVGTDSNVGVTGTITVHNPAPVTATINSVTDAISGVGAATVNCGVTFPYTLAASSDLSCTYSAVLSDTTGRTNTATATLQNTPSGTTTYSGTAPVTFGDPTSVTDNCIDVSDTLQGTLGTEICSSQVFTYSRTVGPFSVCGPQTSISNTASFITSDTETTGSSSWTVNVNVPCPVDDRFMTGGGSINPKTDRITHGFELHCDPTILPNNLEINWGKGNNFHLTSLTTAYCFMDTNINGPRPPVASFNTYVGTGTGLYNGVAGATISFTFTDVGEPGKKDTATYLIKDKNGNTVQSASGSITSGNQQAHGSFTPVTLA